MTRYDTPYASDDEFDIVSATDGDVASQPPQPAALTTTTTTTQSATTTTNTVGRLPLSPATTTESLDLTSAPPVPPKPSTYAANVEKLINKITESSLEDSFVSTSKDSDYELGGDLYSKDGLSKDDGSYSQYGKRIYKSLKSRMDWSSKEILIAVMGMTGSGKTTFISKVTGRTDLKIGHDLTSCTQEIQVYETEIEDHIVRFVDTPGFSDTYLSDTEVLEMIADYLAAAYTKDVKLSGIIYLHPISDNRVTHHATKNLEMFRKLTGEKNLKNVVLATSMWDKVTSEEGAKRERELKEKFWKMLITFEAKPIKYRGTPESAREIAVSLMENKPFYLQLQEEMGKGNKALKDTAAGREIMQELVRMKEQHAKELVEMKDMILKTQEEKNDAAVKALEEHYQGMLRGMEKTLRDERRMNDEAVKSLTERISALESRGMCHIM